MVVQHNLRAMNSNRMLGITTGILSKSAEKLSSGYKVNRAADDAAGLSISEKMRKQIRGLTQASLNAEDGISSVQTAEGALTEVHDMLQRMNELANKASNGTNSVSDRQTIQDEIDQLLTEVDRVSETTKFNETYLLKGNTAGTSSEIKVNAHDAGIAGKLVDKGGKTATFALEKALEDGDEITIAGEKYTIGNKAASSDVKFAKYNATSVTTGAKELKAGDTITYSPAATASVSDYKTATMVGKVKNDAAAALQNDGTQVVITDDSGHETTYTVDSNATSGNLVGADGKVTINAADLQNKITDAFAKGHAVTMTKFNDGATTHDVNWDVVEKLESGEIGGDTWCGKTLEDMAAANMLESGKTIANTQFREVELSDVKTTFTSQKPIDADKAATAINMLKAGDTIDIEAKYRGGTKTTITIADETDAKNGKYSTEDALKLVNQLDGDLDEVTIKLATANNAIVNKKAESYLKSIDINVTAAGVADVFTVTDSPTQGDAGSDVITAKDAYAKIADALQQASSIGTDAGKEAVVKNNNNGSFTITKGSTTVKDALKFNLHVGADADMTNKIGVTINTMDTKGLGIQDLNVVGNDKNGESIDDGGNAATYAIDAISDAIAKVSAQRSLLGAVQNRLEHTINNLDNVVENTTAAESQIRDTDMATEMVKYSNANILSQAGQSMLAQANQGNQGVLSLLG